MTPEQERWAEALAVHRQHGDNANLVIIERITTLARAGDMAGVKRWQQIAARLDAIFDAQVVQH